MKTIHEKNLKRLIADGRAEVALGPTRSGYIELKWKNGKRETCHVPEYGSGVGYGSDYLSDEEVRLWQRH